MKHELTELTELGFDEIRHIYTLNGETIPSVSAVMSPLSQFRYAGVSAPALNAAAGKGTEVHNSIETFLKYGIEDISPENRGYLDAFIKWKNAVDPEVYGAEYRVYHSIMKYAGTCDLICGIDDKLCLIDYKTTSVISEMTCGIQLEAYKQALSSHDMDIRRKFILHLKPDGDFRLMEFPCDDLESLRVFGALHTLYNYMLKFAR